MTILRSARIVLPFTLEQISDAAHEWLQRQLCIVYGGYTVTNGQGAWIENPPGAERGVLHSDTVRVYDIAMADTDTNADRLVRIAHGAAAMLKQKSVYYQFPDGRVFIDDVLI